MSISLSDLWLAGHFVAPLGGLIALWHLALRSYRLPLWLGGVCGIAGCLLLLLILQTIHQSFFGVYRYLAWVIAFFAAYAVGALAGHMWLRVRSMRIGVR